MKVEHISLEDLTEDPANVRRHPERNLEAIKGSLRRFGQQKPIVIDSDNVVRAGNGTLKAARELGWKTIACIRSELHGAEATAYAIADNRTSELAEWDNTSLAAQLEALLGEDESLALDTGFTNEDITALVLNPVEPPAEFKEPDDTIDHTCPKCGYQWKG